MNECFFIGNIQEEINFKFILNGKNNSIATFPLELLDNEIINIIAYNEKADYCFRKFKKQEKVLIYGYLSNFEGKPSIILQHIENCFN